MGRSCTLIKYIESLYLSILALNFLCVVLAIEPRVFHMLVKHSTTEVFQPHTGILMNEKMQFSI